MQTTRNSRFARGTGVYACNVCTRKTRATGGDNHTVGLCEECYEMAGLENALSDNHSTWSPEEIAKCEAEIARLKAVCIAKGGKL
jgi:hypothetical protein